MQLSNSAKRQSETYKLRTVDRFRGVKFTQNYTVFTGVLKCRFYKTSSYSRWYIHDNHL